MDPAVGESPRFSRRSDTQQKKSYPSGVTWLDSGMLTE